MKQKSTSKKQASRIFWEESTCLRSFFHLQHIQFHRLLHKKFVFLHHFYPMCQCIVNIYRILPHVSSFLCTISPPYHSEYIMETNYHQQCIWSRCFFFHFINTQFSCNCWNKIYEWNIFSNHCHITSVLLVSNITFPWS